MKITNDTGLPTPLYKAIVNQYLKGAQAHQQYTDMPTFRVSSLIDPPRLSALQHYAESKDLLTEDAAERIYALLGSTIHDIVAQWGGDDLAEEKLEGFLDVYPDPDKRVRCRILGTPDYLSMKDGVLTDWKIASKWELLLSDGQLRPERALQLNFYAWLLRHQGYHVNKLQNVLILRDWSKTEAARDQRMPQQQVVIVEQPMMGHMEVYRHLSEIVARHLKARELPIDSPDMPRCTDEERWAKPAKWAVYVNNNKTAIALGDTKEEAIEKAEARIAQRRTKATITNVEYRPGKSNRCEHYCRVRHLCSQWLEEIQTNNPKEEEDE